MTSSTSEGHAALARSEWELARESFRRALEREETPECLEGLGTAAFWLDDATELFDARERAFGAYRRRGDQLGAARVAMAIADDHFSFRGEVTVAKGWVERARRLLAEVPKASEHGWLQLTEGYFALMLGEDPAGVSDVACEVADTARRLGDIDLEMTALAQEGLALVIQGRASDGMPRLDEATTGVVSGEMSDQLAVARTCCLLLVAWERTRDFDRAAEWCQRIEALCRKVRFHFPLAICRAEYASILIWRGEWSEAESELQAAIRQLARLRPALQQEPLFCLAELQRRQGRFDAAQTSLQLIERHPLSILGRAALALDQSDPALAARLAEQFLRLLPPLNLSDRVDALELLSRSQLDLGLRKEAKASFETLRSITDAFPGGPMRATTLHLDGLIQAAEGDYDRARTALEDAIRLYVQSGASFDLARCRLDLARVLGAVGERDSAESELERAWTTFDDIGARHYLAQAASLRDRLRASTGPARLADGRLTRREVEVLRLVAQGLSNQKIAAQLGVSEFTIKRHVANLLAKLELPSRAAAAAYAAQAGLL